MKRSVRPILTACLIPILIPILCLLSACSSNRLVSDAEANDYREATAYHDGGRRDRFTGTIVEVGEYSLLVAANEESGAVSGRSVRIAVSGSVKILDASGAPIELSALKAGDPVRITYDGSLLLSDPPRISKCYEIRLLA